MCSAWPKVLPAANDRRVMRETSVFFTQYYDPSSLLWANSTGTEKIKRPVLPISINVSTFWSFQRGSVSQQRHCIMFLRVSCWRTLPRQGNFTGSECKAPPATATTGHLPSQSKPDTNAIYGSCCRTRQASQPLFINVQIGFIHGRQKRFERKSSEVPSYFLKEINSRRLVGNSTQNRNTCK